MTWNTIRKWWARIGAVLMVVFFGWGFLAVQDWGVDPAVLTSDGNVTVEVTETEIRFLPRNPQPAGLIFFQGALVDPEAYAPFLRKVADAGYPAYQIKLPLRGFSTEAAAIEAEVLARAILQKERSERRWIVGGHSKGGLFASRFAAAHRDEIDRLLLIGTAHPREIDLSDSDLAVTKIVATRDGIATPHRVRAAAHNLPPSTRWIWIEGGNHSQFGHFGFLFTDRFARISRAEQQAQALRAVLADLAKIAALPAETSLKYR